ncbi:glycosyltransferase family 2 protein [Chitinophaga sp. GbtcB8]|uniref:glycosyltransferase family 2 protein n=1 Tax=Chitinophaga sp. GbtcB8 TaxID=2824753 RepID=UPI001C30ED3D|nr:glycosyltransferase family 2 protein [Chitinophaga sp. GbtcB8]
MKSIKPDANAPLVSVIIPNYNHAAYLEERITSVLNQSFSDFEVIILDDCSTDNSREIIERYRDHPKVKKIIYNEVNGGSVFRQWKKGVEAAAGKYIWMAESDDYCEASLLQHLVAGLEKHDHCTIAYCQSIVIDMHDNIMWQSFYKQLEDTISGREFIIKYLSTQCSIFNASMALFRRALFFAVDEAFLEFKFSGDWYFWIELCKMGDVFISGRTLNYFRNHSGDVTTRAVKTGQNYLEAARILTRSYDQKLIPRSVYWKAFKKQHRQYYFTRNRYKGPLGDTLDTCFYNRKTTHLQPVLLRLDAWWKGTRMKFKHRKDKRF